MQRCQGKSSYPSAPWAIPNRGDMIDPAILRPGWLDVKIKIERPDAEAMAWGRSLGCRPIWATATSSVRLASLAQRSRGATTSGRMAARSTAFGPGRQRERTSRPRGCIRRPMGHPPWSTTCTAVRGASPLRKKVVNSQRTTKARRSHSLPLLTYSRLGGLRQDPGRAGELAAGPRMDEDMGARRACVVVDLRGRGDEPLVD
jgi:hypothetical protein